MRYWDSEGCLRDIGRRPQRPLWASTSPKNPTDSDTVYVEVLMAAHCQHAAGGNTAPHNELSSVLEKKAAQLTRV